MKVLITHAFDLSALAILDQNQIDYTVAPADLSTEELISYAQDYDALINVGHRLEFDRNFFLKCPRIQVIALFSVGFDQVHIAEAKEFQVLISNTPDVLSKSTSDIAFLLMLSASRKAFSNYQKILEGSWNEVDPQRDFGIELYHKTLGIFGLGRIGIEMAKKCKAAYGMEIIYHNRSPRPELEQEVGARYVSFDELIQESDVISIHASLNDSTAGLFDKKVFDRMKSSAILVNTARGGIVNQEDLYEVLRENRIFAAGLDVTVPEPLPQDDPLLSLPNICILPHIGSATFETRKKMAELCVQNIVNYKKTQTLLTPIY